MPVVYSRQSFRSMVDFNNTEVAFRSRSDQQLKKASWLFRLVSSKSMVGLGKYVTNFAMRMGLPIRDAVKQTVYDQFVGGESIEECEQVIQNIYQYGVYSLLDFAVEGKETELDFDHTKEKIRQTIQFAAEHEAVPFAVFKVTGIARFALLEKISSGKMLSPAEAEEWEKVVERVRQICQEGYESGVNIFIDAEETWIQQAIDDLAEEMMRTFNGERAAVVNTLQMYRTDRLQYLDYALSQARRDNYYLGVKLVRGAYMEKERRRARKFRYPSPIQPDKMSTDRDFDAAVKFCFENRDRISVVAGSHNEESCRKLVRMVENSEVERNDRRIWFSQLFGMSDNLSFNLAAEGYNVVKYLPFGPVKETLPYLIRRAEENTSAGGQSGRELSLIGKEIKRRGID